MNKALLVRNRQQTRAVNMRLLRKIARTLVADLLQLGSFELAIYVVGAREMTRLNEMYLKHRGSTDVLAFDYGDGEKRDGLFGELFVCTDEALVQATRFRTKWQSELVRYVVHGTLHLVGYDDHRPVNRRRMKKEEGRLLRELARQFEFGELGT